MADAAVQLPVLGAIVMKKRLLIAGLFLALGVGIAATYIFPPHPVLTDKFAH